MSIECFQDGAPHLEGVPVARKGLLDKFITYKYELHAILDCWRSIYGPLPWAKQIESYQAGDFDSIINIYEMRSRYGLKGEDTANAKRKSAELDLKVNYLQRIITKTCF